MKKNKERSFMTMGGKIYVSKITETLVIVGRHDRNWQTAVYTVIAYMSKVIT